MSRLAPVVLMLLCASLQAAEVRELVGVPAAAVKLDGSFDEPFWQAAPGTSPFVYLASDDPAPRQTRARVAFDANFVYLALEADEPDTGSLSAQVKPRDGSIWQEDALELMLQPSPGSTRYFHFAFTPAGSRYDAMTSPERPPHEWNPEPDWQVAVTKQAGRWQAEVAIPFKALAVEKPLPGELWGLKICRTIVGRGGNRKDDYPTSWSYQPSGSYHDPMGWGRLYFGGRNILRNGDFSLAAQANGLPEQWSQQLVWQADQAPTGKVEQATVEGRPHLRLTKFESAGKSLLPRASTTALVRGGRRFRATAEVRARGEVVLALTMHSGNQSSHMATPFTLSGDKFETLTVTSDAMDTVHAISVLVSFGRDSGGELLVRQASLVDEGPPPLATSRLHVNHGLGAACEALVDMKPYDLLRDEQGRYVNERLIFTDEGTGTEIWRITSDWSAANATYSNMYPWSPDGSAFRISTWERPGGPYVMAEADGAALRLLPELPLGQGPKWGDDPDWMTYGTREALMQLNWRTGETREVYRIPEEIKHGGRPQFNWNLDLPGIVYYEQAFGPKAPLYFIDLKTGQVTRLPITSDSTGDKEKDWLYSANLSKGQDGKWWVRYSLNHLPHLSEQNPYQQRASSLDGKVGLDRLALDQPAGKGAQPLYSHGGTQPSQKFESGFSGGGICLWDFAKWEGKMLVPGPQDGHISWEYLEDWFFAGTNGRALTGPFSSMLLKVYTDGTWYPVAHGNTMDTEYNTNLFANISPDGTKGSFSSTMLGPVNLYWCVISYPEPPVKVRGELRGGRALLTWEKAARSAETAGYHVYRSARSGTGYERLTDQPVAGLQYEDAAAGAGGCYVVTAVERSGLESRCWSGEVALGNAAQQPERLWMEAERGTLQAPLRENLHGSASNLLFVDYRDGKEPGRATYTFNCRRKGPHTLWGRIRYQGGGTPAEAWPVAINGKPAGSLTSTSKEWEWRKLAETTGAPTLELAITASESGFAIDKLLLTDDMAFTPKGEEKLDSEAPAVPQGLKATSARQFDVAMQWQPVPGARHYQVYRAKADDVAAERATLIASPTTARYVDWGLQQGTTYSYRVSAVDSWGNESAAGEVMRATTVALPQVVDLAFEAEQLPTPPVAEVVDEKAASGGKYVKLTPEKESFPKLELEFEVPVEGDYVVWLKACPVSDRGYAYASVEMDGGPYSSFLISFPERAGGKSFGDRYRWRYANAMRRELPVRFHLTAGRHRLRIGSEPHHQEFGLDQIVISNDLGKRPEGRHQPWE